MSSPAHVLCRSDVLHLHCPPPFFYLPKPLPPPTWLGLKNFFPTIPPTHQKTRSIYDPIRNCHLCLFNKPQIIESFHGPSLPSSYLQPSRPHPQPPSLCSFLTLSLCLGRSIHIECPWEGQPSQKPNAQMSSHGHVFTIKAEGSRPWDRRPLPL